MVKQEAPIGVFDSGVGGISVLRELVRLLPQENFIYIGDSIHAPYGTKPHDEVHRYVVENVEKLLSMGAKAIVVACNTATSVSVRVLRSEYPNLPIIGIEPAIKPAAEQRPGSRILVMATPITLSEEKFRRNLSRFEDQAVFISLPCPGLMELIEAGHLDDEPARTYLTELVAPYMQEPIGAIVLGCTHYPFIRELLAEIVGPDVLIIDGANGTARETRRRIAEIGLLNPSDAPGKVEILNSLGSEELLALSHRLLEM